MEDLNIELGKNSQRKAIPKFDKREGRVIEAVKVK